MSALLLWCSAHPVEALVALGIVLNLVNGALPARVRSGALGRVLHVVLDRVTVLTRRDAPGTLKWPVIAGSLLRGAADAIDPNATERSADSRASRVPPLAVLLALGLLTGGCASGPRSADDALRTTLKVIHVARAATCNEAVNTVLGRPGPLSFDAPATAVEGVQRVRSYVCADELRTLLDVTDEMLTPPSSAPSSPTATSSPPTAATRSPTATAPTPDATPPPTAPPEASAAESDVPLPVTP